MPIENIQLPTRRVRRKRREAGSSTAPAALVLVSASYSAPDVWLFLTFDRAINVDAMDPQQCFVDDPANGIRVQGGGAYPQSETTVLVEMFELGPSSGSETTVTVGAGNGIVAADDGAAWAGVTDLELPFP